MLHRCVALRKTEVPRSELQDGVQPSERAFVRRGLDALVDHGLLFAAGKQIGFNAEGKDYLAFFQWAQEADATEPVPERHAIVDPLRAVIDDDPRLAPSRSSFDQLQTLPGRLESYREARRTSRWGRVTMVIALGAVAAAAFVLH
ncbi:conserved hypothetical protein [Burkholderiales bacterium 8X]|nr:conserved hypothetical protein [Burkholderiales bacterium 8X]